MNQNQEQIVKLLRQLQLAEFKQAEIVLTEWCDRYVTKDGVNQLIGALVVIASQK